MQTLNWWAVIASEDRGGQSQSVNSAGRCGGIGEPESRRGVAAPRKDLRGPLGRIVAGAAVVTLAALVLTCPAQAQEQQLPEEFETAVLDPASPHRVYVLDAVFPHLVAGKIYVVDGDDRSVLGQINTGYVSNLVLAPDHSEIFVLETYFSRGTRGERTDLVTVYDPRSLAPIDEVILPNGRFLTVPKRNNAGVTKDGRYLLSFNMFPGTTVSVVDLQAREFLNEIEVPGCVYVFPWGGNRVSMLCGDGSLFTLEFDERGNSVSTATTDPFFDPDTDPVLDHPAVSPSQDALYFITYGGTLHTVELSGDQPTFQEPVSLLTETESEAGWRPGGWQVAAVHEASDRLFVLMHVGGEWTHKNPGTEVWIYDLETDEKVDTLVLAHAALSIEVTQDSDSRLFALSETGDVSVYETESLQYLGSVPAVGETALQLTVGAAQ